ncbi:hypothetical protein MJO29_003896 [Puccinia striiformis f. sp. tritici]|uniref:hypothetical protein n=1 Tax=Puccinia striiformis f. sp. tritici TaxID=168172 RepID=UPI0020081FA6|nr:hypothetical protein Pst134EA_007025 [Puccinia striiformis f. sp. tritici]KAH9469746.1 hypothetical protein Pst134EA_007025 [Puccinia striiformis f. sp. tritici]KAI7963469.1 hypothetical protein MJO29_003896 [Puccinia striiformis f. sp. tritici]
MVPYRAGGTECHYGVVAVRMCCTGGVVPEKKHWRRKENWLRKEVCKDSLHFLFSADEHLGLSAPSKTLPVIRKFNQIQQDALRMVPSIRSFLLLLQLGVCIVCNASENPTRRITLSLFPGGGDNTAEVDDIDDMLHLSLAQPQATGTNSADVTTTDRATSLSMRNLSIPSEDGRDVPRVPGDQLTSIASIPLSSAAGTGSGQLNQRLSRCARQAHPSFEPQNSQTSPNHAQRSWCFTLLPAGIEDENRKSLPTRAHEQHFSNDDPTWSWTENNASLQPGMNPSKQPATKTQMTASSFSKCQGTISRRVSPTADTHVQYQPAKRIKHGHQSPACTGIQGFTMRNEHHHPQREVEDRNLLIMNQLRGDIYAGASRSRNPLTRPSQNFFMNSAKFSGDQEAPSTILTHAVEPEHQQVKLKITDIVNFNANVFEQDQTQPEQFQHQAKVDSILSIIENIKRFSPGDKQLQPSESHLELLKKMIHEHSHLPGSASRESVLGDGATKKAQPSKRTQWNGVLNNKLEQNKRLWFTLWKERTAGVEWPEITGRSSKCIERNLAILMIYIDSIGTIFQGYYPTDSNSIGDPSSSLLKKAIELVKPSIEDKTFLMHKFTLDTPYQKRTH